ncbi:MAG: AAA family ATPase [Pseudomonadota bacterium]
MSEPNTSAEKPGTPKLDFAAQEKPRFSDEARRLILSKTSLVYISTFEDARCEQVLRELAKAISQTPMKVYSWTVTAGLDSGTEKVPGTEDSIKALDFVIGCKDPALFVFKDLNQQFAGNPMLIRKLRDTHQSLRNAFKTVFIVAPSIQIPDEISKEISILDFELPTIADLEKLLEATIKSFKNLKVELTQDGRDDFIKCAMGLTWDEAKSAFVRACMSGPVLNRTALSHVIDEKCKIVRKEGILEYVPVDFGMQELGGLDVLKEWLEARSRFFSKEAREFGLSAPRGVLLTGISGCGKSSCVKVISQYWRLPLMRLDMAKVYGGTLGNPEETMRRVLKTVEAVAPVVLWIEEIEKGVAGYVQGDAGVTARIFSSFLTWMQERTSIVFIAATANEIDKLPPELLRKGRFDEIFFLDLPSEKERGEIFKVHILRRKHNPEKFSLINLAKATVGFSGAEIEQIVASGMFEAFNEKRQFNDHDLYKMIAHTVPLSTTMAERIKEIKRWADQRAVRASKN